MFHLVSSSYATSSCLRLLPPLPVAAALLRLCAPRMHQGALIMASQLLLRHGGVDLVVYNAGTDVLAGDPLGRLGLSRQGIVARDEAVWSWARDEARAPIVMLLSGGYAKDNAAVIMESLANLFDKFGLGAGAGTRDGAGAGEAEGGEGPALASGGKL